MTTQEYVESISSKIIQRYQDGISTNKIAEEFNVNRYYIWNILKSNNVKIRNARKFKKGDIDKLVPEMVKLFDNGISVYKIAKEFGTDVTTTMRKLRKQNRDTSRGNTQREEPLRNRKSEIIEMYLSGKSSVEIGKILNCPSSTITIILNENRIKIRPLNKYTMNHSFFEKISSDEQAFCLGFFFADGTVSATEGRSRIGLIDKDMVYEIAKRIEYTGPIYERNEGIKFEKYQCKKQYQLNLSSKKLRDDLVKNGCVPNKTLILKFPTSEQVPEKFLPAFIRGYMDGDGSIGYSIVKDSIQIRFKVQFTSTKEFCEGIMEWYLKQGFSEKGIGIYKANSKNDKNTYYLAINGEHCIGFLDALYKDSTIHLHRKWMKYMQLKEYFQYRHLLHTPSGRVKGKQYVNRNQYSKKCINEQETIQNDLAYIDPSTD